MQPVSVSVIGTGTSTIIIPDTKQNPFQCGLGVTVNTSSVTWAVEHCFDFSTVMSPTWNGSTLVTWFQNTGLGGTTTTGNQQPTGTTLQVANGNYAFPVAAIRLNVYSSGTTTCVTSLNFIQSVNSP